MADRFYHPGPWNDFVTLDGAEAHHLARVLRAEPGEQVELFDGHGGAAEAEVIEVAKRSVLLRLISPVNSTPRQSPEVVLAVASPKGERLAWMIEKVTELGVDRLIPLQTARSVVIPGDQKLHKLEQTVIAACKQSGRNRLLRIDEPCPLTRLADRIDPEKCLLLIGNRSGQPIITAFNDEGCIRLDAVIAVIGPEGGLTAEEESLLTAWGARSVCLSRQILRVETAAIAMAAALEEWRTRNSS